MLRPVVCALVQRWPERTGLTGWLGKPDLDDRFSFRVLAQMPGATLLALWTGHDMAIPVDLKLRHVESAGGMRLPTGIHMHWPDQIYPGVIPTLQDALGADVARVNQVLLRQQFVLRQGGLDGCNAW